MKRFLSHSSTILGLFISALVVVYLISEVIFYISTPSPKAIELIANEEVENAKEAFQDFQRSFRDETLELADVVIEARKNGVTLEELQHSIYPRFNFWGVSVHKNDSLIFWSGFPKGDHHPASVSPQSPLSIKIINDNNVVYLQAIKLELEVNGTDTTKIQIKALKRLRQQNLLSIGKELNISVAEAVGLEPKFPVYFSLFNPVPQNVDFKEILYLNTSDSVGAVYTHYDAADFYLENREKTFFTWRFIFFILFILLASYFFIKSDFYISSITNLLLSYGIISLTWLLIRSNLSNLGFEIVFGNDNAIFSLASLLFEALVLLLLSALGNRFYLNHTPAKQPSILKYVSLFALLLGVFFSYLFLGATFQIFNIINTTDISVFAISPIPTSSIVFFYIFSGFLWVTYCWFTINSFLLLFKYAPKKELILVLLGIVGFVLGLWLYQSVNTQQPAPWQLIQTTLLFLFLALFSLRNKAGRKLFLDKSRVRLLITLSFISAVLSYIPSYFGEIAVRDQQMQAASDSFNLKEEEKAEEITIQLLSNLETVLSNQHFNNLEEQKIEIQSLFKDEISRQLLSQWEEYSFSVQLIGQNGESISEYTTDLNAPGWTKVFDIRSLEVPFEEERIRRIRLRPIIRETALERPSTTYSSYRQGWIPFFSDSDGGERLGWIICSVYREKPQYHKAFRAVVSYTQSSSINTTIHLNEFENGILSRTSVVGVPLDMPGYSSLNPELLEQIKRDSVVIRNVEKARASIKEVFIANNDRSITRIATFRLTTANHIYALLRFFFTLFIVLILISTFFFWSPNLKIIGHNKKFKDRLLDRFILASFACMLALIATSYGAVVSQSNDAVTDDLSMKLDNLREAIDQDTESDSRKLLFNATLLIDADAILYRDTGEINSTAPQIFSQNLLPDKIPWDVYNKIVLNGSEQEIRFFTLGNQQLLIGFKPIIKDNKIVSIAGIPTFLRAPKFNEQVLSTTSYLMGFFALIFGLFIIGAAFMARQLISPLEELSAGIKTIPSGNLETTLPVKSNDEIGALTKAYNVMVIELKALQQNLVEAEREAAWKEMAQQIAHEIKNPLTPMKLNLQHLSMKLKNPDITSEELKSEFMKVNLNLIEQIDSLSLIASDFSKFSRPLDQPLIKFDISELLTSVLDLYAHEESVVITSTIPENPIYINGVKDELRRVFINLIKNAIEAMPDGGSISIATTRFDSEVEIKISDTGDGISLKNKGAIFTPNFSTKTSGTGLGLAIAKKIIEAHAGSIDYESEVREGTTFIISLPLWQDSL
ncbi:MAG: ATP-binding protein [Balneolaceae bacterium]